MSRSLEVERVELLEVMDWIKSVLSMGGGLHGVE